MLAQAYAAAGRRDEARSLLERVLQGRTGDPVLPYEVALVHAALGEADEAFSWLEKGFRLRDPTMVSLKTDPLLDPLREDERFQELLRRMAFPP
jgi:serine/threonine-protein kinase